MKFLCRYFPTAWSLFLLLWALPSSLLAGQVAATVNDQAIHLDELVGPRDPTASQDTRLDDRARVGQLLNSRIMRIIFNQAIAERHITASSDEIEKEMEQKLVGARIGEKEIQQMAQLQDTLVAALVEVQKDPQRAQEIFAERLTGSAISENAWAVYVANYRTPEKIEQLKKLIPRSVEDVKKNSAASSRHDVLLAKLKLALVAEQRTEKDAEAVWRSWTQSAILGARIVVTHQGIADELKRLGFTNVVFAEGLRG